MRLTYRGYNDVPLLRTDAEQTEVITKLTAYEDAEEQGLLVRLPCKVGDTVYVLRCGLGANFLSVYPSSVIGFKIGRIENTIEVDPSYQGYSECYSAKDWGAYVFPTREDAEAALKGGQDETPAGSYDLLYEEGGYNSNGV